MELPTHKHTGQVEGFTLAGRWHYREYDFYSTAGSYIHEPAGSIHTLHVPEDNTAPTDVLFVIEGALINLGPGGEVESVVDGELTLARLRGALRGERSAQAGRHPRATPGPGDAHRLPARRPGVRGTLPGLPRFARRGTRRPQHRGRLLGAQQARRRVGRVDRSGDLLLAPGGPDRRDRGRLRHPPTMMHTDPPERTRYRAGRTSRASPRRSSARSNRRCAPGPAPFSPSVEPGVARDVVAPLTVPFPLQIIAELLSTRGQQSLPPRCFCPLLA